MRLADVRAAIDLGADEVDFVLNRSAFLDGEIGVVAAELRSVREAAGDAVLKVILEVCELEQPGVIREATRLAIGCGADFVKTSSGKSSAGATPMAVVVIAEEVAAHAQRTGSMVGIKIAGGVHTAEQALGYVAIVRSIVDPYWMGPHLLRFGASSLMREMVAELNAAQPTR